VSEQGAVFVASASGSQLAAYVYGAGAVLWVVGCQMIVPDREAAFKWIDEYSLPREAYGVGSEVNKVLVANCEFMSARMTVIMVKQELGFWGTSFRVRPLGCGATPWWLPRQPVVDQGAMATDVAAADSSRASNGRRNGPG
jgi:hypothetical protein